MSPPFVIDSHIHLWEAEDIDKLAWCEPSNPLARGCAPSDYVKAVNTQYDENAPDDDTAEDEESTELIGPRVGYIFLECDRKNDGGSDWTQPLEEVKYLRKIIEEEASSSTKSQARCLAFVPWAPIPSGPAELEKYIDKVQEAAGPVAWPRVRGFRYLLQDKPHGTMLKPEFVDSLKLLGRRGFSFDLGIDQHRRGRSQLDEAVSLVEQVHTATIPDKDKVVLVINHMAKPDLTVLNPNVDRGYVAWRDTMFTLGKASPDHIYMKVSGLFSEMPSVLKTQSTDAFFSAAMPWLVVLMTAFGPSRLMFGSDWPVCTASFADTGETGKKINRAEASAWDKWRNVVTKLGYMASLSEDDQAMLWAGTAVKAYGLETKRD